MENSPEFFFKSEKHFWVYDFCTLLNGFSTIVNFQKNAMIKTQKFFGFFPSRDFSTEIGFFYYFCVKIKFKINKDKNTLIKMVKINFIQKIIIYYLCASVKIYGFYT